jgi:hypothetical protein
MDRQKPVETLEDLVEVIARHERSDITRMLRTLKGHISMAADKPANQITLSGLVCLRPVFCQYLVKKQEDGSFTRNTRRSYLNYFRILTQKAGKFGSGPFSPEIKKSWSPIKAALSRRYDGSIGIVRDAVAKGISPIVYSEQHLNEWREQMEKSGRHPKYIRCVVHRFRKRILESGLSDQLPRLSWEPRKRNYGLPLETLPEPLRTQVTTVLQWKEAAYVRGRPNRYRCRPVTVLGLRRVLCGIAGFAQTVLGKAPQSLPDLLSEEIIGKFAEWLLRERGVDPLTVVDLLRMIPPLEKHPLLKGQDFKWVHGIMLDLPPHDDNKVKERKQRKFVRFDLLAKVVSQLEKKADAATDVRKKAILMRNALLIQLLRVLAWRQRNIRECRLAPSSDGGNIFLEEIAPLSTMALPTSVEKIWRVNPHAKFWQISFDSNGTKSKRPIRALLPRQVIRLLERYVPLRLALLGPGNADPGNLFLNDHGKPMKHWALAHHVEGITSRYLGKQINPHLFRDILAEGWLASGRGLEGLSNILWHVDSSFTRRVYGRMFDESYGTKGVEDWLEDTATYSVVRDE